MHRITSITADANANGTGKAGFTDGNAGLGIPATNFNAQWCNAVQEEMANAVEQSMPLSSAHRYQLLCAIKQDSEIVGLHSLASRYTDIAVVVDAACDSTGRITIIHTDPSGKIRSAADGWTFSARTLGGTGNSQLRAVAAWGTETCAVGDNACIQYSSDVVTWSKHVPAGGYSAHFNALCSGLSSTARFIAAGNSGELQTYNGSAWTKRTSPLASNYDGVAVSGDVVVASFSGGVSSVARSTDGGLNWSLISLPAAYGKVQAIPGGFLVSNSTDTAGAVSYDFGATWSATSIANGTSNRYRISPCSGLLAQHTGYGWQVRRHLNGAASPVFGFGASISNAGGQFIKRTSLAWVAQDDQGVVYASRFLPPM